MSLFGELKRRNVIRVGAAYIVAAWLTIEVASVVTPVFAAPDWVLKMMIAIAVIGFPLAVIFSWAFELTPDGIKKESEIDREQSVSGSTGKKLDAITIGMIVVGIVVVVFVKTGPQSLSPNDAPPPPITQADTQTTGQPAPAAPETAEVPQDRSIAVLPFLNLSSDKEQEYFSDGLADTVLHKLAQLPDLRVAARTSSFKFKGRNEDMREIASLLGVATVLEGSVQRQGDRVRITVQLIKGVDGSHLWSQVFDDTLDDIFRVQDDIARGVVEAMASTWQDTDGQGAELGGTEKIAAYEAYLKGQDAAQRGTPAGANEALTQLQLAVDLDPDYALAWVALSYALEGPASLGTATWESTFEPMTQAAERAVELAPKLAASHLALANALRGQGFALERSVAAIELAVELAPNDAEALTALGEIRDSEGKHREALRLTEKAILINPLDAGLQATLAFRKVSLGLIEPAIEAMTTLVENDPSDIELRMDFGDLLQLAGKNMEAARVYQQVMDKNPDLLRVLFRTMFDRLGLDGVEDAAKLLRRIEVLSPNRALDDHAEFCMVTGDRECYIKYAEEYVTLIRTAGAVARADIYEGVMWLNRGEPERALRLLKPHIGGFIPIGTLAVDQDVGISLALAYDRTGDVEHRDRLIAEREAFIHQSLANGLWSRFAGPLLVQLAAVRGDAGLAAERLAVAIDNDFTPTLNQLQNYPLYDRVREAPEFQAQMARLKARAASEREQKIAEGVW